MPTDGKSFYVLTGFQFEGYANPMKMLSFEKQRSGENLQKELHVACMQIVYL